MKLQIEFKEEQSSHTINNIEGSLVLEQPEFTCIYYKISGERETRFISCGKTDEYAFMEAS